MAHYLSGRRLDLTPQQKTEILERFSGDQDVWVRFALEVGIPALETLLDMLGGNKVHIPMCRSFWAARVAQIRNAEIQARYNGNNSAALAAEYEISHRMAQKILGVRPRRRRAGLR